MLLNHFYHHSIEEMIFRNSGPNYLFLNGQWALIIPPSLTMKVILRRINNVTQIGSRIVLFIYIY